MEITRVVHGVPTWLLKEYLIELGGSESSKGVVSGEGWQASYRQIDDYRIGSLSVGRVHLEIKGKDTAIEELMPRLDIKLMRGGG